MFYNHLSKPSRSTHLSSTHSQPPFYTLTLNKVDEDNWWCWGWLERETIWQRNETQSTGSVGKLKLFCFQFLCWGGIIIFIMDHIIFRTSIVYTLRDNDWTSAGMFPTIYPRVAKGQIYLNKISLFKYWFIIKKQWSLIVLI